jgi:hypothetical protein
MSQLVEIHGNTYPVREQLKALGGKWDAAKQCWMVPADKAEIARTLVPQQQPKRCGGVRVTRGPRTCKACGCRINYGVYCGKCEYA